MNVILSPVLSHLKKKDMKASDLQLAIGKHRVNSGHRCVCENVKYLFGMSNEKDVISVSRTGLLFEYEIKISRADFFADLKKSKWTFYQPQAIETLTPNYFYYVCPAGLILPDEVQSFAGLYWVSEDGVEIMKKAKLLHKYIHKKERIEEKVNRLYQERHFLGAPKLTIKNREAKERRKNYESLK